MTKSQATMLFSHALKVLPLLLSISFTSISQGIAAETVSIPIGQQGLVQQLDKPALGMTMEQVRQKFGTPVTQSPARGTPPITRWEYNQFVTYFEGKIVIHSVTKFQRKD